MTERNVGTVGSGQRTPSSSAARTRALLGCAGVVVGCVVLLVPAYWIANHVVPPHGRMGYRLPVWALGWGRLQEAVVKGDAKAVHAQLALGTNPSLTPPTHPGTRAPAVIITAATTGRVDIARMLLDAGADVNSRDDLGDTPLSAAAGEGHIDMMRLLLHRGAKVADAGGHSEALCEAATSDKREAVAFLLAHGAKPNQTVVGGGSLLLELERDGRHEVAEMLRKAGAR